MWDFILAMGEDFHAVHIAISHALCLAINSILGSSLAIPEGYLGIRLHTPFYQLDSVLPAKVCRST